MVPCLLVLPCRTLVPFPLARKGPMRAKLVMAEAMSTAAQSTQYTRQQAIIWTMATTERRHREERHADEGVKVAKVVNR